VVSDTQAAHAERGQWRLHLVAALILAALALGGAYTLYERRHEPPGSDGPAGSALAQAAQRLSETYGEEKDLVQRIGLVRQHIDEAIDLVEQAGRLDPEDQRQIATLRVRLLALEDPTRLASADPATLRQSYEALIAQLNALAQKLQGPAR
jgi:hypothetical protein